ncbi:MAG: asnS [Gammaproteobacteria bacterium]|jgi:asparaginyl-tRNA synthetase|nr:asnS [Gammaproteobacteria bacterium]
MTEYAIKTLLRGGVKPSAQVTVKGWVRTRRDSKAGISFITVHDGSCFEGIQAVVPASLANYTTEVLQLTTGCSVIVSGELVSSKGQGQSVEIQVSAIQVIGWVEDPDTYPISPKAHTMEYLRTVAHLRPRTNTFGAVARVRNRLAQAIHRYFDEAGFLWLHSPIITASDCEGAGELFRVSTLDLANLPRTEKGEIDFTQDFFGKEAFLTVSGQLNAEAYCLALSKVYTFGPTFRAENSNTSRHLAEFWMLEPEVAFADLTTAANLAEDLLKYLFKSVLTHCQDDMAFFEKWIEPACIKRLEHVIDTQFARTTYTDAVEILSKAKKSFQYPVKWGIDLQTEHERYLAEDHFHCPVIVTDYPKEIKAFYMRMNEDGKTVAAMDILAPGIGELVGGSQREERLDHLDSRMDILKLPKHAYHWYYDLRRYGTVPHAGFGLGFDRLVSYVTGMNNIRDVIPFPRVPNYINF